MDIQDSAAVFHRLIQCQDIQEILDCGRELYRHPLMLCDATYRLLAVTREDTLTHAPWLEITQGGGVPMRHTNEPETVACYRRSMETGHGQIQPSQNGAPPMLRRALCSGDSVMGYLDSPCYEEEGFTQDDCTIFDLIADLCTLRMARLRHYGQTPDNLLEYFISDLLEGRITNQNLIEERFRYFSWKLQPPLQVVTLQLRDEAAWPAVPLLESLCRTIQTVFPRLTGFVYGNRLKFLVPSDSASQLRQDKHKKLLELLEQHHLSAGISRQVSIPDIAEANRQSEKALELGTRFHPRSSLHLYDDLAVFQALEYCSAHTDVMSLCHSAIYTLAEYDRTHESSLLESLETLLRAHGSVPEAAGRMFIHRNTMSYRIKKIHELVDLDLDDSETVFHLQLSFHILEYYSVTVLQDQEEQRKRKPQME